MSNFERKYSSLEISCFRDYVDMNVNHGNISVHIIRVEDTRGGIGAGRHTLL